MKTNKMSLWVFLTCMFLFALTLKAQKAKVETSGELTIEIRIGFDETGAGIYVPISGDTKSVLTPSSNFLKTFKFKVPEEIMEQVDFGGYANLIKGVRMLHPETGELMVGLGYLNKAGILTFTIHSNGAGNFFPHAWF